MQHSHRKRKRTVAPDAATVNAGRTAPVRSPKHLLPLGAALMAGGLSLSAGAQTAPSGGQEPALPELTVKAEREADEGALARSTRIGKVVQDPHEIAQSITIITDRLMQEQHVSTLKDAMRNVPGLTFNAAEGGRSGDNMSLRGFYTFGDMYLDAIRDTAQYNRETFNFEQIDVLRGASSMLFGRGQAGGVINQVSKTPLRRDQYLLTASVGQWDYHELTADLNARLTQNESIRVNLMSRGEGSWRSNPASGTEPELYRDGIGLSLGFNLYTNNQFWLNQYTLRTRDNPDYGVAFDPITRLPGTVLPVETFFGIDSTFDDSNTNITTLVNEYRFAPDTQLRTQLRYANYKRSYWAKTPSLTIPPNAIGSVGGNQTRGSQYETVTLQSDFSTTQRWFDMTHGLLAGFEYLYEDSSRKGLQNFGTAAAPDFRPYALALAGNPVAFDSNSYAIYAQDTVEFVPNWKATAGIRRDELRAEYPYNATSPRLNYGEWSYRGALSYQPAEETHYYLGYSDSFSPTADLYQLTVVPQPAERSQVLELGAKWLLLDGDLALRAAIYRATKEWERNTDLEATAAILTTKRRTDGIEFEVAGRINEHWQVFGGVALMAAEILEVAQNINPVTGAITLANPGYTGQRPRNTPPYTANLWTTYAFGEGWTLGGGIFLMGERYAYNPSGAGPIPTLPNDSAFHPNTAPAYVRFDLMASYQAAKWAVRLNVKNVLDEITYDSIYDNGAFTVPGTRRAAIVTGELKF
jgi:catecholate siderophore receptor